jgi:single-stranded-DNA-specific exonuclease
MPMKTLARTNWIVADRDRACEERLQRELGIQSLVSCALSRAGLHDPAKALAFLNPSLDQLHSPSLLPDIDEAVKAILGARERKERIYIHGDYDVDGVTSAALLTKFLKAIQCDVHVHVPHRMKEGYGIRESAVAHAQELGAKLFLTCDCGGSAIDEIRAARALGMTVVVTDHHHVGEELPDANAFVNPHRPDSTYPFPNLCGAGVAFKVCQAITAELGYSVESFQRAYMDLVCLGTVADVMPLIDENRVLVKHGLPLVASSKKPGIKALLKESGVGAKAELGMTTYHIGFGLAPRLNAAGRIDDAALALKLLLASEDAEAQDLARQLEQLNQSRRNEQEQMIQEAIEMIEATGQAENPLIVVGKADWHPGIIGIVAGRIKDHFHRPVFVFTFDEEKKEFKGSARSIPGFHLAEAIKAHPDIMAGGGHAKAAGVSVKDELYDEARKRLMDYAADVLRPEDLIPALYLAGELMPSEVTFAAVEELDKMAPYGEANREPTFAMSNLTIEQIKPTRNPDHPQIFLKSGDTPAFRASAFHMGSRLAEVRAGDRINAAIELEINEFNGRRSVGYRLKEFSLLES